MKHEDQQLRRFFTDENYREEIKNVAQDRLASQQSFADWPYGEDCKDEANFPYPPPYVDQADVVARAIIANLRGYGGGIDDFIGNLDLEVQTIIKDVSAEIVRQGTGVESNSYEQPALDLPKAENVVHNTDYGDEHVLRLNNGNEIRVPPYPISCDYVRVVRNGREVAYWSAEEWEEQPAEVMGAIMGAADTDEDPIYGQTVVDEERTHTPEAVEERRIDDINYELRHFHAIADRWGTKPGLTQLEACHGAIREAYAVRFNGQVSQPQPVGEFNPNRVYDAYYDMTYANQIKERTIRAAKDLFKD